MSNIRKKTVTIGDTAFEINALKCNEIDECFADGDSMQQLRNLVQMSLKIDDTGDLYQADFMHLAQECMKINCIDDKSCERLKKK